MRLRADEQPLESCVVTFIEDECPDLVEGQTVTKTLAAGTQTVDVAAWCVESGCPYGSGPLNEFAIVIYGSTVTVNESIAPTVVAPAVTGLVDGWAQAGATVTVSGSDQLGLRKLELVEGGATRLTKDGVCVDWSVRPCADGPGAGVSLQQSASIASLGLSQGEHVLRARATDGAGNVTLTPTSTTVKIDTIAPVATGVSGAGASREPQRTVAWTAPTGGSPIASAAVELCGFGTGCETFPAPVNGPFTFDSRQRPKVTAAVKLTDTAGNVGTSDAVIVEYDDVAPTAPWVDPDPLVGTGAQRTYTLTRLDGSTVLYRSRLCVNDVCSALPDVLAGTETSVKLPLTLTVNGQYRVEVSAVDAVGNASAPTVAKFGFFTGTSPIDPNDPGKPGDPPKPGDSNGSVKKQVVLGTTFPKKLGKKTVLVKGTVNAGSSKAITVVLSGRRSTGKTFRVTKTAKPNAAGKFSARIKLPARIKRKGGVLVTVTAKPATGWIAAKSQRKRLR